MKMKKFLAVCLSALTVTGMLAGCGGAKDGDTSSAGAEKKGSSAEGSVYYLNFKPEIADQWEEIAAKYTEETGVPVKVKTAASNQYEQTLKSERCTYVIPDQRTGWISVLERVLCRSERY